LQAQIIYSISSDPSIRPFQLLYFEQETALETETLDSIGGISQPTSIATDFQTTQVNLYLAYYSEKITSLTYRNEQGLLQLLTNNGLQITQDDLPPRLYKTGWGATLPISIGDDVLTFTGGTTITSDRNDITDEDYNNTNSFNYYFDPKGETSWRFGLFQRTFLGQTSELFPLVEVSFNENDFQAAMGVVHFPELPQTTVSPFFRFSQKTDLDLDITIIYPFKFSIFTFFTENWSFDFTIEREFEYYRLTQSAPFNSTVLSIIQVHSTIDVGYHLYNSVFIETGIGFLSERKYTFLEEDLDAITDFKLGDGATYSGHIALAFFFE